MRAISGLFATFILFIFSVQALAQSETDTFFPTPARHLIIIDYDSGEILYEKNARTPMQPASMTKIMTASIVFDQLKSGSLSLEDEFFVSEDAWRRGGAKSGSSTMFLDLNTKANVADLLRGVIVQSGNDACIVLAEGIAGSEANFAGMMNEKAQELGLDSANFKNSTGWPDDEHVISAHDLALLAAHTIREHPELYKIYAERNFTWNGIPQGNRNPLFVGRGFSGADGLKTGHTEASKYGFVGSAIQDGKRRIFVVNGLSSKSERITESMRIMTAAFSSFDSYKLYEDGDEVGSADVYMGTEASVPLVVKGNVSAGLHKAQRPGMTVRVKYSGPIPAPITAGDQIAELIISAPKRQDVTIPLYAGQDVAQKSFFARVGSAIINKIRGE